jgi:hypothetical protein
MSAHFSKSVECWKRPSSHTNDLYRNRTRIGTVWTQLKTGNCLISWATISLSRRTLFYGVIHTVPQELPRVKLPVPLLMMILAVNPYWVVGSSNVSEKHTVCIFRVWRWRQNASPNCWYLRTTPRGISAQKTDVDRFIVVTGSTVTAVLN